MSKNKTFKKPTFPRRFGHLTQMGPFGVSELLIGHVVDTNLFPKMFPNYMVSSKVFGSPKNGNLFPKSKVP
jgi:hypothetical protein